jgi:L-2-hydroxycarboxylate dehydrogenase (NAD+)
MLRSTSAHHTDVAEARSLATSALENLGVPPQPARVQADHLIEAELRGHPSHGLRRLPILASRIRAGLIVVDAEPEFVWGAESALRVDGRRALGPVVAYRAIEVLLGRVSQTGVAVAALHNTHHLGMLAPYVERLSTAGCIGAVLSSTEGLVHPWGGAGALLGTNPLGLGVPAPGGDVTLDMSTGAVSAGKILDYAARGQELPAGWAVDSDGHPTQDATAAVTGTISPFGGPKGYALSLTLGALVGALTGTSFGTEVRGTLDSEFETTKGDVIVAIDLAAFGQGPPSADLGRYLTEVRQSGVDGGPPVTVPGDRARASRARAKEKGFDVTEDVWAEITELAAAVPARQRPALAERGQR